MSRILITGADGYLGRGIIAALLRQCGHELVLWCHARTEPESRRRREDMLASLPRLADRAQWHYADLRDPEPFAMVGARGITQVIHAAAAVRFNVDKEVARQVNVEGTRRLLEFARRCPDLQHLALLGSLYAAGHIDGDIAEERLPPQQGFANYYEWSKRAAEDLLHDSFRDLPASVLRLATVIADEDDGTVSHFNVVHNSLRLLFYGLMTVWPGDPAVPVYVVTRQLLARAVAAIVLRARPGNTYHLAPDARDAIALGPMLDVVHDTFQRDHAFRDARILKPLLGGRQAFEALADGAQRFGGPALKESVASIRPFAPQLFSAKRFHNQRLRQVLGGWCEPASAVLVRNTADYLVRTRWGLR